MIRSRGTNPFPKGTDMTDLDKAAHSLNGHLQQIAEVLHIAPDMR